MKKTFTKVLAGSMAAAMVLGLGACGGSKTAETTAAPATTARQQRQPRQRRRQQQQPLKQQASLYHSVFHGGAVILVMRLHSRLSMSTWQLTRT